ncbi:hypothetical protein GCM10007385_09000 [Tateyamaria omphalii]|uniref:DUF302 domain-containing protein n=1 Tax=Tateyamaria omphalii TaxID=299262 RepID=UPI0016773A63|nr:DUF302 domain-containing protein [Tateyamaria omphalii]GGX43295.1 hypothetical protein GCM10007385_09000 [Tateyamaria omphalii]
MRLTIATLSLIVTTLTAHAEMTQRDGWSVTPTSKSYDQLIADVKTAAKANKMGVVTQAGPTGAAKSRGITIPGNRVIGLFNNVYAVNILNLSTAAMIEAPVRVYVTENADGTATLSYKKPSMVFAPYIEEAGPELATLAQELDAIFTAISDQAAQ